ncbi:MAG: cytochrome c oxidase assembly protein [Dehalococcoidia bacterium]
MAIPAPSVTVEAVSHVIGERWGAWDLEPVLLVPAALLIAVYVHGLDRWRERSRPHSAWRTASFISGVLIVLLALLSPLHWLADHHFTFHMVQHELLMMVAAPLILLGAPTTPILRGIPRGVRRAVLEPVFNASVVRTGFRWLTHPVTAFVAYTVTLYSWHFFPGWYAATVTNGYIHDVQHLTFLGSAMLVWWNVIDPRPLHAPLPYPMRMAFLFAVATPKAFMGAFITYSSRVLYEDAYGGVPPVFDMSLATDQVVGGMIMWVPSLMMYLIAIGIVFFVWTQKSEASQREADARRDALATAEAGD